MALVKCGECGQQMSDRALKCPHCGAPAVVAPRALFAGVAAGLFLAVLGVALWLTRASDAGGSGHEAAGGPPAVILALIVGVAVVTLAVVMLAVKLRGPR